MSRKNDYEKRCLCEISGSSYRTCRWNTLLAYLHTSTPATYSKDKTFFKHAVIVVSVDFLSFRNCHAFVMQSIVARMSSIRFLRYDVLSVYVLVYTCRRHATSFILRCPFSTEFGDRSIMSSQPLSSAQSGHHLPWCRRNAFCSA